MQRCNLNTQEVSPLGACTMILLQLLRIPAPATHPLYVHHAVHVSQIEAQYTIERPFKRSRDHKKENKQKYILAEENQASGSVNV